MNTRPRIHSLDGLRGVLALYVALFHLGAPFVQAGASLSGLSGVLGQAWYSVDVFFVMSGFVMAHVYGDAFAAGVSGMKVWAFFKARVARLYPVHLLALGLMAVGIVRAFWGTPQMDSIEGRYSWAAAAMSVLMLHGPWLDHRTWNYPAWSISAEWHAYALFPLFAPSLMRLRGLAAQVAIALCVGVPLLMYLGGHRQDIYPTNGLVVLLRVLPLFFAGVLLHGTLPRPWQASNGLSAGVLLATAGLLFMAPCPAIAVLLIPAVIACTLGNEGLRGAFSHPALVWLGKVSYSLYMTHALVEMYGPGVFMRWASRHLGLDVASSLPLSLVTWLGSVALALLLAWAVWRWIEAPGRAWVLRRWPA